MSDYLCTIPGCEKRSKRPTKAAPCTMHQARINRHGEDAENLGDMARKGRSARGSKHRAAKLTEVQVMEARRKYATGRYTLDMLGAEYGLTRTPVSQLVRGITWKHLPLIEKKAA